MNLSRPSAPVRRLLPLLLPALLGACAPGDGANILLGLQGAAEVLTPVLEFEAKRQEQEAQRERERRIQQEVDRARAERQAQVAAQRPVVTQQAPMQGAAASSGPSSAFDGVSADDASGLLAAQASRVPQLARPSCVADFGFLGGLGLSTRGAASASYLQKSAATTLAALLAKGQAGGLTPVQMVQELRRSAKAASGNLPGLRAGIAKVYAGNDVDAYLRSLGGPGPDLSQESLLDTQAHGYLIYSLGAIVFSVQADALEVCLREGKIG